MIKNNYSKQSVLFISLIIGIVLTTFFQNCGQSSSDEFEASTTIGNNDSLVQKELLDKGKEIARHINSSLINTLMLEINKKGFEDAIAFCSLNAIPITDSISKIKEVSIQRVSHKSRNVNNEANETELQIINQFRKENERKHPVIISGNGNSIFYAPIYIVSPLCIKCHGKVDSDIQPEVYKTILAKYPFDKATGFEINELRGLLKIVFDKKTEIK